jgi:hypothetical protein
MRTEQAQSKKRYDAGIDMNAMMKSFQTEDQPKTEFLKHLREMEPSWNEGDEITATELDNGLWDDFEDVVLKAAQKAWPKQKKKKETSGNKQDESDEREKAWERFKKNKMG